MAKIAFKPTSTISRKQKTVGTAVLEYMSVSMNSPNLADSISRLSACGAAPWRCMLLTACAARCTNGFPPANGNGACIAHIKRFPSPAIAPGNTVGASAGADGPHSDVHCAWGQVSREGEEVDLIARGRHDPCVVPRAVPMVDAMAALVLADQLMQVGAS